MTNSPKLSFALLGGVLLAAVVGLSSAHAGEGHRHKGDHRMHVEQHMARLTEKLDLSDDQALQVQQIFERAREQFPRGERKARGEERPSKEEMQQFRAERQARRDAMHQYLVGELSAVLSPEQLQKFETLHEERQRRGREKSRDQSENL